MCGADPLAVGVGHASEGSPPRVRSRRPPVQPPTAQRGITSACAEQTPLPRTSACRRWDHLRVCGADLQIAVGMGLLTGSPPRVRSRLVHGCMSFPSRRITSACAEQTRTPTAPARSAKDHLRVCGADNVTDWPETDGLGSPPRVRSRQAGKGRDDRPSGITSACAEQTAHSPLLMLIGWDHLRVCGADDARKRESQRDLGSPPRVRSRRDEAGCVGTRRGITSACAEQTTSETDTAAHDGDHLRVCGADMVAISLGVTVRGSPPRVRSRRRSHRLCERWPGITSACAEQTTGISCPCRVDRDHLRVCGADCRSAWRRPCPNGSPPRVRSRPARPRQHPRRRRITSACAEQTSTSRTRWTPSRDHLRVCGADTPAFVRAAIDRGSPPRVRSRPLSCWASMDTVGITSACAEQTSVETGPLDARRDHLRVCGADSCILLCSEPAEWRGIFDLRTA